MYITSPIYINIGKPIFVKLLDFLELTFQETSNIFVIMTNTKADYRLSDKLTSKKLDAIPRLIKTQTTLYSSSKSIIAHPLGPEELRTVQ